MEELKEELNFPIPHLSIYTYLWVYLVKQMLHQGSARKSNLARDLYDTLPPFRLQTTDSAPYRLWYTYTVDSFRDSHSDYLRPHCCFDEILQKTSRSSPTRCSFSRKRRFRGPASTASYSSPPNPPPSTFPTSRSASHLECSYRRSKSTSGSHSVNTPSHASSSNWQQVPSTLAPSPFSSTTPSQRFIFHCPPPISIPYSSTTPTLTRRTSYPSTSSSSRQQQRNDPVLSSSYNPSFTVPPLATSSLHRIATSFPAPSRSPFSFTCDPTPELSSSTSSSFMSDTSLCTPLLVTPTRSPAVYSNRDAGPSGSTGHHPQQEGAHISTEGGEEDDEDIEIILSASCEDGLDESFGLGRPIEVVDQLARILGKTHLPHGSDSDARGFHFQGSRWDEMTMNSGSDAGELFD